jgi:DNA primase
VPYISNNTIDEIKTRADAVAIIGEYVRLEKRGSLFWGLCPFHNEKTPSFSVNPDRKSYYCFGCHEGGGVVNFIMTIEKLSFPEALRFLADKLSITIQYDAADNKSLQDETQKKNDITSLYERLAGSFHFFLCKTKDGALAKNYAISRGVSAEMIEKFNLGWSPTNRRWLYRFLIEKGYSPALLKESNLFSKKYPEVSFFAGRLMFPIRDWRGRAVAFGGRILPPSAEPKYINSPESLIYKKRETLFALDYALPAIRRTREAVLCEGYMDVIAFHQAGIENAVAPLGTAFTDAQARLLHRWVERLTLVFDSDTAGQTATCKAILICHRAGLSCSVVVPNGAKDPSEILQNSNENGLHDFLKNSMLDAEYLVAKCKKDFLSRQNDPSGLSRALSFLRPFYESLDSASLKENFYKKTADRLGLEPVAVLHDLEAGQKPTLRLLTDRGKGISRRVAETPEVYLLTALAVNAKTHPELFEKTREQLPLADVEDADAKQIYWALEECYRENAMDFETILSHIDDVAVRQYLMSKSAVNELSSDSEKLVAGMTRRVVIRRLENRKRKVLIELRLTENQGKDTTNLLVEAASLTNELRDLRGKR